MEKHLQVLSQLETSIEKARFLPFLGSGISSLRSYNEKEWSKVGKRLHEIRRQLVVSPEYCGPVKYLDSFAKAHQIDLDDEINQVTTDHDQDLNGLLTNIQMNIVILNAYLVQFFGIQMNTSFASVSEVSEYEVPVEVECQSSVEIQGGITNFKEKIVRMLFDTMNSLHKYLEQNKTDPDLLKGEVILEKLLIFCIRFDDREIINAYISDPDYKNLDLKTSIPKLYKLLKDMLSPMKVILIDELGWMEDLLWHTLRFDIPVYLTQNEITFLLSLEKSFYELRRLEMPQTAEMRKNEEDFTGSVKPFELIYDHLMFCKQAKRKYSKYDFPEPTDFHLVLAAALCNRFDQKKADEWYEGPLPIAISTNFDQELEWAFMKLRKPFIVVFPLEMITEVRVGKEENGRNSSENKHEKRIKWFWRQYSPPDYGKEKACTEDDCTAWEESELYRKLIGPVIVKLHGSPLERKPSEDMYKGAQHFLMLSEHDYMKASMFTEKNKFYPAWLESQQEAKKSDWWFLGYDIKNWYERMRIYQHVSYTVRDHNSRDIRKWLIKLSRDFSKGHLLDNLEFTLTLADLDAVTVTLSRMTPVRTILEESKVKLSKF